MSTHTITVSERNRLAVLREDALRAARTLRATASDEAIQAFRDMSIALLQSCSGKNTDIILILEVFSVIGGGSVK